MILANTTQVQQVTLPDDLLWVDELNYTPVTEKKQFSLGGALIVDRFLAVTGRPITLEAPDRSMCWIPRSMGLILLGWVASPTDAFQLTLEYPTDTRAFTVQFDIEAGALEMEPVKGFPQHDANDWFWLKSMKLMEVA